MTISAYSPPPMFFTRPFGSLATAWELVTADGLGDEEAVTAGEADKAKITGDRAPGSRSVMLNPPSCDLRAHWNLLVV